MKETGLEIAVGPVALVNEFHDPDMPFHQVDIFFRATIVAGDLSDEWVDPEGIVQFRRFVTQQELGNLTIKPSTLPLIAFDSSTPVPYDALEMLLR